MTLIPRGFVLPTSRRCNKCGIEKPMSAFYTRSDRPLFVHSHWFATCRQCVVELKRQRYQSDPEKSAATRKRQRTNKAAHEASRASWGAFQRKTATDREQDQRDRKLRMIEQRAILKVTMPTKRSTFAERAYKASLERATAASQASVPSDAKLGTAPDDHERHEDTQRRLEALRDPHQLRIRRLKDQTAPRRPLPFGGSRYAR